MASELFILAEKEHRIRDMGARYLRRYLSSGCVAYPTAKEAEAGRHAGDAYEEPGLTRVVGFRVEAFLPKKKKARTRR